MEREDTASDVPDSSVGLFNEECLAADEGFAALCEPYKLYVQLTGKVSERRQNVNAFFLSLNSVMVTGLTVFLTQIQGNKWDYAWAILPAISGVVASIAWRRPIRSYGQMNAGRFDAIHLLETRLPARLFEYEWQVLEKGEKYRPFSETEAHVPLLFIGLYVLAVVGTIIRCCAT